MSNAKFIFLKDLGLVEDEIKRLANCKVRKYKNGSGISPEAEKIRNTLALELGRLTLYAEKFKISGFTRTLDKLKNKNFKALEL